MRGVKPAEEVITSTNPLKVALGNFGTDSQDVNLASAALDIVKDITNNILPATKITPAEPLFTASEENDAHGTAKKTANKPISAPLR